MELQEIKQLERREEKMTQVFVSYHYTTKDLKFNGFGNYIGEFDEEAYSDDKKNFILDLQEAISKELQDQINMECQVKVLFFR